MRANPNPASDAPKRVLMVVADPATSSVTGWPAGFGWAEVTHPRRAFIGSLGR